MKKSRKIIISSICAGAVALAAVPTIAVLANSTSQSKMIDNDLKSTTDSNVELKVNATVAKSDENTVTINTSYTKNDAYELDKTYWEMKWEGAEWEMISSLSTYDHNRISFSFDRKQEGNYYVRKTVIWKQGDTFTKKSSQDFLVSRKLTLRGKTQNAGDYKLAKFNFTFGVSASTDTIKFKLEETQSDYSTVVSVVDQSGDWVNTSDKKFTKIGNSNDYIWTKTLEKNNKEKFYKLIFEVKTKDNVTQKASLVFSTLSLEYDGVETLITKTQEWEELSKFDFKFKLKEGDKISYKIVNFQPYGDIVEEEQKEFVEIEKVAKLNRYGWYSFSRSYQRYFTANPLSYYLYVKVIRKGTSVVANGGYRFSVPPRPINKKPVFSTKMLHDTSKMIEFFRMNGGFSRANIERLNKMKLSDKVFYFNNYFIYSYDFIETQKELQDIKIYLVNNQGSSVKIGVEYYASKDYFFREYNTIVKQFFYDVKKA